MVSKDLPPPSMLYSNSASIYLHIIQRMHAISPIHADCIGLPITLQITARVTWSGWPRIARSHTEISLSLSELLHRGTNLAFKLE